MGVDIKAMFPKESRLHLPGFTPGPAANDAKGRFAGMLSQRWGEIEGHIKLNKNLIPGAWVPKVAYVEIPHEHVHPDVARAIATGGSMIPALRFSTHVFESSSIISPFGVASSPRQSTSSLLVVGTCFQRTVSDQPRSIIHISCDQNGTILDPNWKTVPITDDRNARNDLGDGFVTGVAGFTSRDGQGFFFVEFYAWPPDPIMLGG